MAAYVSVLILLIVTIVLLYYSIDSTDYRIRRSDGACYAACLSLAVLVTESRYQISSIVRDELRSENWETEKRILSN